jgi:hypothetical protein
MLMIIFAAVYRTVPNVPLTTHPKITNPSCRFHLHRLFNAIGLLLTTVGMIIAWTKFEDELPDKHKRHEILGVLVLILAWLQPINAFLRPHAPVAALSGVTTKTKKRLIWEIAHRLIGLTVLIIAVVNVFFGFAVAKDYGVIENFKLRGVFIALVATLPSRPKRGRGEREIEYGARGDGSVFESD